MGYYIGYPEVLRVLIGLPAVLRVLNRSEVLGTNSENVMGFECSIHKIELVTYCPACRGSATSKRKVRASRENGKLGGRPKGSKNRRRTKT